MKTGNEYRRRILEAAVKGGRGHLGGSFSCIEILMAFQSIMTSKDEFVLSKGHAGIALYSMMFEDLSEFLADGSALTEHPSGLIPGIRLTTGSLGHGIGLAAGIAKAKKLNNEQGRVYVLMGDGECMEGSVYEGIMFAVMHNLDNLFIILDSNGVMSTRNFPKDQMRYADIFSSMGCAVGTCDGHDFGKLQEVLRYGAPNRPFMIVAETIKGKGVSFMEGKHEWHNGVPSGEQLEIARRELQ